MRSSRPRLENGPASAALAQSIRKAPLTPGIHAGKPMPIFIRLYYLLIDVARKTLQTICCLLPVLTKFYHLTISHRTHRLNANFWPLCRMKRENRSARRKNDDSPVNKQTASKRDGCSGTCGRADAQKTATQTYSEEAPADYAGGRPGPALHSAHSPGLCSGAETTDYHLGTVSRAQEVSAGGNLWRPPARGGLS